MIVLTEKNKVAKLSIYLLYLKIRENIEKTKLSTMLEKLIKQSSHTFYRLLLILFVIGLYSCEFDSDDLNYVQLEKPKDEIQLGIDLAGVNPTELIYVYDKFTFSYSLYTEGKDIFVLQFFLDGNPIESNNHTGSVFLDTNITDDEIHELRLIIGLKTGTGSLAELANYEMYTGEFVFKIKIIPFSDNLNVRETTDANNNLKLEWDKPANCEIAKYSVYKGDGMHGELLANINNPNETYFVDTDYAYGYKSYTIVAEVKNSFNLTVKDHFSVQYSNMTENDFETRRISANEVSIKWENPNLYPCRYVLTHGFNNEKIIIEDGVNEAIIPAGNFPNWAEPFSLYILPATADINRYGQYVRVDGRYSDKSFEGFSYCANVTHNMFYALDFNKLRNYQLSTMKETSWMNHDLTLDTGCEIQVSTDGKIAIIDTNGAVHVYSNHYFSYEINQFRAGNYPFKIIGNNKILVEERNGFKLYDISTKDVITSKSWESEFSNGEIVTKTSVSQNGKYIYVQCFEYNNPNPTNIWVELYEVTTDNMLRLLETDNNLNVQSIHFNPNKNNEAIIQYFPNNENKFVIVDILTKERKEIKGEFMNIDPFTGNLLFKGEEYQNNEYNLYVWNKDYSKEKIKIELANINTFSKSYLYNNILFFNNGYLDLSNLKEWKQ